MRKPQYVFSYIQLPKTTMFQKNSYQFHWLARNFFPSPNTILVDYYDNESFPVSSTVLGKAPLIFLLIFVSNIMALKDLDV